MNDHNFLKLANDRAEQERAMRRMEGHVRMLEEENALLKKRVAELESFQRDDEDTNKRLRTDRIEMKKSLKEITFLSDPDGLERAIIIAQAALWGLNNREA